MCAQHLFERNKLFVRMENFSDLLFQLMKHGTNSLHVVFIFLFSIIPMLLTRFKNKITCLLCAFYGIYSNCIIGGTIFRYNCSTNAFN